MAEQTARQLYENFCAYMDSHNWTYNKHDAELFIDCEVTGEDIPFTFHVRIDEKLKILCVFTTLLPTIPEDKRLEVAVAVNTINMRTLDGGFDFGFNNGILVYRITTSYRNTVITPTIMGHMIGISGHYVDKYNDKFADLVSGKMSIDEFIEFVNN